MGTKLTYSLAVLVTLVLFTFVQTKKPAYPAILIGSEIEICTDGHDQGSPIIAFDGTDYLVVWHDNRNGNYDIYAQFVSSDGSKVGVSFPPCLDSKSQNTPAIAFDGTNYLVVWEDERNPSLDIYGQFVGPGSGLGNFRISSDNNNQGNPAIAFAETNYLVVWKDGRNPATEPDVYAQLVGKNGNLIGAEFAICDEAKVQWHQAIAPDGSNYLVVWEDYRNGSYDIYGQFIDKNGNLIGGNFAICNEGSHQTEPAITYGGDRYLVVWEDYRHGHYAIYGQFVSVEGELIGENIPISTQGSGQDYPAVSFDGTHYLVVWRDYRNGNYDIYGQFLVASGNLIGGNFPICDQTHNQEYPNITFDGTNYLVVWEDYRNGNRDIYGQFVGTPGYKLNVSVNGQGKITGDGIDCGTDCTEFYYVEGTQVTLTAMPDSGWVFDHWEGDCSGTENTCILTMADEKSATAVFVQEAAPLMPVPIEQQTWFSPYEGIETPITNQDPAEARPMGVGGVATGGTDLDFTVSLLGFESPVDIYLVYYIWPIDPDNLYFITEAGTITVPLDTFSIEGTLTEEMRFRSGITEPVSWSLGSIPLPDLPPADYHGYLGVTPHNNTTNYYIWHSYFILEPQNENGDLL